MNQTMALLRVKGRILANLVRSVRREPPLKIAVVGLFVALWACGSYALTREGLAFVAGFPGIGEYLMGRLLYLFALGIFTMLIVSSALLAYPLLYVGRENGLLLSMPLARAAITACRVWETVFLGSWAFLLMGVPLLLAYFRVSGMGFRGYLLSWLFFLPLVILSGAAGLLAALLLGWFMPRGGTHAARRAAAALFAAAAIALVVSRGAPPAGGDRSLEFLNQVVAKCRAASWFPLPSSWAAEGIIAAARGARRDAWFLWTALASTVLFFLALCPAAGERLLAAGRDLRMSRPAHATRQRDVPSRGASRSWTARRSAWGALAAKDALTFCRDFSQWGQFALFFGLLGLYLLTLRAMPYDLGSEFWQYLLFILNLSALGFMLAGLSSRFFFPLMSLDLARFWFLGVSPLGPGRVLREKYLLCAAFTSGITVFLALLSGLMLGVPRLLLASSFVAVGCMGIAISGLSVGLGALYPNLKASSPAEVISGLGGTIVLIATLGYILCALSLQGLPLYLRLKGALPGISFPVCLWGCIGVLAAVSAAVAALTLRAAKRSLERADL